ncbi:MAG: T9SS type B sorting domain-containing protein, partial [Mucilaginibacter sp.]
VLILTLVFIEKSYAQICTGSLGAPIIYETFGAGTPFSIGPPLPKGVTTLNYVNHTCGGEEGEYDIINALGTSCKGGTWQALSHDHTGDPNGYFMTVNGTIEPSVFFTYKVSGSKLCPNTTYQFAAWIMNLVRYIPKVTNNFSLPNITFSIETATGRVLSPPYNTGDIPETENPTWIQYGTFFTSPSDGEDIVVKMINNGGGGNGNDIAMDDITFSPCGPLIQTGFETIGNTADKNACVKDNLSYNLVAAQTGYPDPSFQWQQNSSNGWVDIPNETSTSLKVNLPDASAGIYQYRIGVLSGLKAGSESCRIFSAPLTINVYPPPVITVVPNTSACTGQPLQLSASGGDNFLWSGPNNFTSAENSPVVTYNADFSFDGDYTVMISKNNCPTFATTKVKVYQAPSVNPIKDVTICAGDAIPITIKTTNATHFQWHPIDGLDHADIANPIASPTITTTYTVSVSNDGCTEIAPTASLTVNVIKIPEANAGPTKKIFAGQTAKLDGTATGDDIVSFWTPADYLDNPSSLTPTTSAPSDITYTLHVESTMGCTESVSSVFVRVYKELTVYNSFSPNGDNINDYWNIKNIDDYPKVHISVYGRNGQCVFESKGYGKPWDGTYSGKKLSAGTYYYVIDLNDDNLPKLSGWVLIIR